MTTQIKNRVREEVAKDWIPDLGFLFSEEVLNIAEELLWELLDEEKADFEEKLKTPDEEISFELFDEESILDYFTSYLYHLKWVFSSDKIREIIENFEPKLVEYGNEMAYNKRYFDMLQICLEKWNLDSEQTKILEDWIKSYKVRWIDLDTSKQDELKEISQKLSKITTDFSNNVLDSENEFTYTITDFEIIKDLPKEVLERVKKDEKYVFTSNPSDYMAIMKYCTDEEVRKLFQQTRTSFASSGEYDNRDNVLQILKLKDQKAKILGFKNYAELSLVFKMADSPEQVTDLLWKISDRARIKAKDELMFLKEYFDLENINGITLKVYKKLDN